MLTTIGYRNCRLASSMNNRKKASHSKKGAAAKTTGIATVLGSTFGLMFSALNFTCDECIKQCSDALGKQ
jgi:hypothetical protein